MEVSSQLHASAVLPHGETTARTHFIGGWVRPRANLDAVGKRKLSYPYQKLIPGHSLLSPPLAPTGAGASMKLPD
jgi:hypothetical protein